MAPGTKESEQMAQSREEVIETMKDVLASELGVEADKVTADARFKEDLDVLHRLDDFLARLRHLLVLLRAGGHDGGSGCRPCRLPVN